MMKEYPDITRTWSQLELVALIRKTVATPNSTYIEDAERESARRVEEWMKHNHGALMAYAPYYDIPLKQDSMFRARCKMCSQGFSFFPEVINLGDSLAYHLRERHGYTMQDKLPGE